MEKLYCKPTGTKTDLKTALDALNNDSLIVAIRNDKTFRHVTKSQIHNTAPFSAKDILSNDWELLVEDNERNEKLSKLVDYIEDNDVRVHFDEWSYGKLLKMNIDDIFLKFIEKVKYDDDKCIEIIKFIIDNGLYKNKK